MPLRNALLALSAALVLAACSSPEEPPRSMRLPPLEADTESTDVQNELAQARLAASSLAPYPYTPEQIRDAMPVGFRTVYRVDQRGRPPVLQHAEVTAADAEGMTMVGHLETLEGEPLGVPSEMSETWVGLRDHATFAALATQREEREVEVPAGRFACWRYTVTTRSGEREVVGVYDFAHEKPGAPIRYESLENGERAYLMELVSFGVADMGDADAQR